MFKSSFTSLIQIIDTRYCVRSNLFKRSCYLDASSVVILWRIYLTYTRFEKARIIGARALQISMGAPSLIKIPEDVIFPIDIAMLEFKENAIPITVRRAEQSPT